MRPAAKPARSMCAAALVALLCSTATLSMMMRAANCAEVTLPQPHPLADPLNSPAWPTMRERFFKDQTFVFDERVKVAAPANAEDALQVPVMVAENGLLGVQEVMVIADLNPIPKILTLKPTHATASIAFRFKVEQSTPIRAAMRTADGVWHIGGVWLSAAGGGCTTPSNGSTGNFQGKVGEMNARIWQHQTAERLRLRVVHPMDTGLASAIPAFYIDRITVRAADGTELATLNTFEPIAENPVFSLDVDTHGPVHIDGHDIQGNTFGAEIKP